MEKDTANPKTKNRTPLIEAMCEKKTEYGFSYGEIAKRSGLPLGTVQKVLGGFTKAPRYETLKALAGVLLPDQPVEGFYEKNAAQAPLDSHRNLLPQQSRGSRESDGKEPDRREETDRLYTYATSSEISDGMFLRESAPVYRVDSQTGKPQGQYTAEDREGRKEVRPSELIDGVIYDMTAPTFVHQLIAGGIYLQLQNCVRQQGEYCIPFMAAADVRLDRDDKTMVMPDVFVVCDPARIVGRNGRYLDGAPDLVIEIASPSTRKKDMGIKLEKYRKAGVREYWIVDYEKKKVIIWIFGDDPDVSLYGFDADVPVHISEGRCSIDFKEIVRQLRIVPGWEEDH